MKYFFIILIKPNNIEKKHNLWYNFITNGVSNMKKIIMIILIMTLVVTGCSKQESQAVEVKKIKDKNEEVIEEVKEETAYEEAYGNLIISEVNTNYQEEQRYEETSEEELVNYIQYIDNEVEEIVNNNPTEKDKNVLKNTFITLTDFIFYDGEIKGKKFSELTTSAKDAVVNLYTKIDNAIETRFPNYKEEIKETSQKVYTNVKEKVIEVKEKIQNEYKDFVGEDGYNSTAQAFEEDKQNVKDVYEVYKPYIEKGKEEAKNKYESLKEKLSNWYQEYKES